METNPTPTTQPHDLYLWVRVASTLGHSRCLIKGIVANQGFLGLEVQEKVNAVPLPMSNELREVTFEGVLAHAWRSKVHPERKLHPHNLLPQH